MSRGGAGPFPSVSAGSSGNRKKTLYFGRRRSWPSQYIKGNPNDSEELLDRLWDHATQSKYAWAHKWRVGDLLVWENRCALNRREIVNPTKP